MSSMNCVILMGGLTRNPELRKTAGGMAITKFSLAVTERFKDKAGRDQESTCYVDVDAWGRLGETCAEYLQKGSQALVHGRLQFEQWQGKDGSKRSKLSVRASEVQFLSRSPTGPRDIADNPAWEEGEGKTGQPEPWPDPDEDPPF